MTTTWKIAQLKRKPTTGLVFKVTYIMNFKLQNETDRKVGMIEFVGDVNDPNFVPFEDLTEEIVLDWVTTTLGEEEISATETEFEARLQERIDKKNNPEFLTGTPWEQE
jgi:hypothetical protein